MSSSQSRGDNGPVGAMADEPELVRSDDQSSSSDGETTVKGDHDQDHVAGVLDEEQHDAESLAPSAGPSSIAHRYREILQAEHDTASDDGSADAVAQLDASPMGSMLSVPDDTPSLHVGGGQSLARVYCF